MVTVALFHSALGVRPGVRDAAARLEAAGHEALVVDQYDGRVFDDYAAAGAHVEQVGFPELMARAEAAVAGLPDGFVVLGWSNGAGMAEYVATRRRVAGAVLVSGSLPLELLGASAWPGDVPVQLHGTEGDPFAHPEWEAAFVAAVEASGAPLARCTHPGSGHLFTDASLPDEYDPRATERLWVQVLAFLDAPASAPGATNAG
jgi:dienelactone hydrolase